MNVNIEDIKNIALQAGQEILKYYETEHIVFEKENKTPLTEADLASNRIIQQGLQKYGFPILSEESTDDFKKRKDAEFVWIVDPLDGTSDFIQKTGEFSVLIGLVQNGQPILGVVFEPALGNLYFAEKCKGAFLEKDGKIEKLHVSDKNNFAEMTILLSRNHLLEKDVKLCNNLKIGKRLQRGSTSKMCLIAAGKAEIYVNTSNQTGEWDTCATSIILREAGGNIVDMMGDRIAYNNVTPKHTCGYVATNSEWLQNVLSDKFKII